MARLLIAIAVLVGFVTPCSATMFREMLLPELVGRANVIVVGTVTSAGFRDAGSYRVEVTATLAGTAGKEVTFGKWPDTRCKVGQRWIFFLKDDGRRLSLVYLLAYEDPNRAEEVRRFVEMKADPKKYLDDPREAGFWEFVEVLGYIFADQDRAGRLTKAEAVAHLRRCLASDDKRTVLRAVAALQRTGSKGAAPSAIPLLRHPDEKVRLAAVEFLEWSQDKRAVGPLCKALDEVVKDGKLGHHIGRALGTLRDPAAAPALERAVKRGIGGWTGWALGTVGSEGCFEALLNEAEKYDGMDAGGGLRVLVYRSNKKPEPWMDKVSWSEKTGFTNKDKWRKWWAANKSDFKVIKTADEAFGRRK
jgi:hypothetical protein